MEKSNSKRFIVPKTIRWNVEDRLDKSKS